MGIAEELREKARSLRRSNDFVCKDFVASETGVKDPCNQFRRCCDCYADMFERIADRIDAERALPEGIDAERALPEGVEWPRFEDGELVRRGDEVEWDGDVMRVGAFWFHREGWSLNVYCPGLDGTFHGEYGELVKRPTPKVLDADGVPIEVGDTVWCDEDQLSVVCSTVGAAGDVRTTVKDDEGTHYTLKPSCLSHKRPDSWERLEEDAAKPVCEYAGAQKSIVDADRYTCLNCPYDEPGPHTDAGCNERMRLDLVSRAKALAKAGEQA